jgi:hypothetical protein
MARFVVNPRGAVHSILDDQLDSHLKRGFREATPEEVRKWYQSQGLNPPEVSDGKSKHVSTNQPGQRSDR